MTNPANVLLLMPKGARPGVQPIASMDAFDLFAEECPRHERLRFTLPSSAPVWETTRAYQPLAIITLLRQVWRAEVRFRRRERRQTARRGSRGRRGAIRLPMAQRYETVLYCEDHVPEWIQNWAVSLSQRETTPIAVAWRMRFRRLVWREATPR